MQYIALIHKNADTPPTSAEWEHFIEVAVKTGLFKGGSEIGSGQTIGNKPVADTSQTVGGYMRFDSEILEPLLRLLDQHPVVKHGGTIELLTMPKS
ncbi:hypothetical protein [Planctomyces sp. SH-PL14]|uniref:hypothetical protein n=1 Tax=Planctomyces sp. SH-PL14 TaxID=1632864 RepID=UPI00078E120C|nr:hypothetical protein [Planctomyces sp. SH-PL14]AMV21517.1 hypothetical protein VT03_26680 [Planctomyces sp. SH-PL14]